MEGGCADISVPDLPAWEFNIACCDAEQEQCPDKEVNLPGQPLFFCMECLDQPGQTYPGGLFDPVRLIDHG